MERMKFINNFSRRLTQSMQKAGYSSDRSKAGIDIKKLAKITGCSYQMSRKYALGQALPELYIIIKIATWLNTSPSWLLFGENDTQLSSCQKTGTIIEIEPELLRYILNKSTLLFLIRGNKENIINFISDAIYDPSHLKTDTQTIYKIIDMMFSSATMLNEPKEEKILCSNGV